VEARVAGAVGHVPGLAVNRRERIAGGRTILRWNPDGLVDNSVSVAPIDALTDAPTYAPIATIVSSGCHPVVVGLEVAHVGPEYVGALRDKLDSLRPGGVTLFLRGTARNVLPLEAFQERAGAEKAIGERIALGDADVWGTGIRRPVSPRFFNCSGVEPPPWPR
jgi:hypothetical protein